jgi:hypothetical protein
MVECNKYKRKYRVGHKQVIFKMVMIDCIARLLHQIDIARLNINDSTKCRYISNQFVSLQGKTDVI